MHYVTRDLQYYQGDRISPWDVPCAARPSPDHVFTGTVSLDAAVMWRLKTQAEIDAEKDQDSARRLMDDRTVRLLFEINFDQENRLRTLQGQPTITRPQYRNALIATWRAL